MKASEQAIRVEQNFKVSKEALWRAISEVDQMTQWFFENIEAFEAKIGFKTRFIVKNEGKIFPHLWTLTEVLPLQKLVINWKYEGYSGDSDVIFELIEEEDTTKLKLTHQVLESFPQHIPEFKRASCLEGWNYFIKERLKDYLNKKYPKS